MLLQRTARLSARRSLLRPRQTYLDVGWRESLNERFEPLIGAVNPREGLAENRHTSLELFRYPMPEDRLTCSVQRWPDRSGPSMSKRPRDYSALSARRNCIAGESEDSMTAAVTGENRYD